ncbi:MAG TPA: zinc-binding dehydrogenase [Planctomycetaceae bacterium]|nr:zinc-binding dehydrogenase [Planctomycetaceae bacterium]
MKTLAAVLVELRRPLELVELEVPALAPGQALVQIACSGVCHTQVLEVRGYRGPDRFLPHCLGHEGSGTVLETGPAVTRVKPGDRVVLSWIKGAGADVPGTQYSWNGKPVNAGGITTFSRLAVVSENRLTPLDAGIDFAKAALLGCAIPTGLGTVFNTAAVRPGQSVAVFGAGGIGSWAVIGAALSGAHPVIAVDRLPEKVALAVSLGATHGVCTAGTSGLDEILELCPGGVDVAIEATGRPEVMQQALMAVRPQGGVAVIVGNAHHGESWPVDPRQLNQGKRILGTWGGDNQPDRDFPRYQRLMTAGLLSCDRLLTNRYPLTDINRALDDLEAGRVARPLIDMHE